MEVFRLAREKYSTLTGKGASLKGARWNSAGVELIYTAANRSLAMAEVAVHFSMSTLPGDYVMITIFIPDDISLEKIPINDLPYGWNLFPPPDFTKLIGDGFQAKNRHCVLQVPSSVTKGDFNLLVNPYHDEFKKIKIIEIEKFPFDRRIFKGI